jgi:hypothetical protein
MELDDVSFDRLFMDIQTSAFRLQTLPTYLVDAERDEYSTFLTGQLFPDRESSSWLRLIRNKVASGADWLNIHLLPSALTPYLRYLIDWGYVYQAQAGAQIRCVLDSEAARRPAELPTDYWLFDDKVLVWLSYGSDGRFLKATLSDSNDELNLARKCREWARLSSVDLATVLILRRKGRLS